MVLMFEFAPPFRWRMKIERFGPLTRVIWAWFSVSYIGAGVNQMARAFRLDEREACAQVCETFYNHEAKDCAEAIRARSAL